jgi:hypothetical protein
MMHLIKNSLKNKKHILKIKMHDAGYYIYNKERKREAWVGVFEKGGDHNRWSIEDPIHNYLVFIVYYDGMMAKKIWDLFDDEDDASGIYETLLYSKLNLNDISKEKTEKKQREIIQTWIDKILEKLL